MFILITERGYDPIKAENAIEQVSENQILFI